MKKLRLLLLFSALLGFLIPEGLYAQLIVTDASDLPGWNADSLVRNILLDNGVTISNARFNGSDRTIRCNSIGIFETGSIPTNIGMESGLILATGDVAVAIGPNNETEANLATSCESYYDEDLAQIASGLPNDVAVLEFDFVPWDETVSFNFVFASEEYMEYVGMDFNDVFGFFVDGVNPAGGYYNHQNMALIPGTTEVVSIDNVNQNYHSEYYIDNTGGRTIQFDGFTTLLEVSFNVVPMSTYHIKMAICDVNDQFVDSGVFLEAHSFSTNFDYSITIDGMDYTEIPEGYYFCKNKEIEFNTETNWHYDDVTWYFGDGASAQGERVFHTYDADGFYTVTNVLHNPHRDMDSLFISKVIEVRTPFSEEVVSSCDSYSWHGTDYTESGTYTYTIEIPEACDSTLILHLTINPSDTTYLNVTTCDEYEWYNTTYSQPGVYTHLLQNTEGCDSLLVLNLDISGSFSSEEYATACNNYVWRSNTYTESGTYTDYVQVPGACDSTLILHLTINPSDTTYLNVTACDEYEWYNTTYSQPGVYTHLLQNTEGCDSLLVLSLDISGSFSSEENVTTCNSYVWRGNVYTESGTFTDYVQTPGACDSIFNLNLTVNHGPAPLIVYTKDARYQDGDTLAVITNTEHFSFQYDFYVKDEYGHINDWDSCVWRISKESWRLEPDPAEYQNETERRYCRVYVAEHDNTPTTLECTIYNSLCEPDSITRCFHLKSSFFGIEDQYAARCAFDIVPNPNNGAMELHFENMEGKVDIKVYDVTGVLLDSFVIYNDKESRTIPYNLSGRKGLYFIVVNGKEGTVTKRMVVR